MKVNRQIIDNGRLLEVHIDTSTFGIQRIEWVSVKINIQHGYFGDLLIELYSPSGTRAILVEPHKCFQNEVLSGYNTGKIGWEFGNHRFLDEKINGSFKFFIQDKQSIDNGYLESLDLIIMGR